MTVLTINDMTTASTNDINTVVRRTLTENFAKLGHGVQFCEVGVGELDSEDVFRFIDITLDGVFFRKETAENLDTWREFKAKVSVLFDSPDDHEPDGGFHGIKVENRYGHEMITKEDVAAEEWPRDGKTSHDTLRNLVHCLIAKGTGYPNTE